MQKKTYSAPLTQSVRLHLEGAVSLLTGSDQKDPGFSTNHASELETSEDSWEDLQDE